MNNRFLIRSLFAIWALAVAALSVISYSGSNDLLISVKLTSSGFVMHGLACFVGMLLCFLAFDAKNISFVVWTGLLIFIYSVVLEVVQFYLPYRTFNVYDIVGNGVGVILGMGVGAWRCVSVKSANKVFRKQTLESLTPGILGPSSPTKLENNHIV
jgi:glycopeptide antibiotics resistance protein